VDKIKTREELTDHLERFRDLHRSFGGQLRIGFTSGSFDILHAGHVDYLEKAKQECNWLVVGVNSDSSIKKYKGDYRPIISEDHRIKLVAALGCVDYVFIFNERRNAVNIQAIKPDYYIKAGDYKESELTSAKYLKPWKGQVMILPHCNHSSFEENIQPTPIK